MIHELRYSLALLTILPLLPVTQFSSVPVHDHTSAERSRSGSLSTNLAFEVNKGQVGPSFDYVTRAHGYSVALSASRTLVSLNHSKLTIKLRGGNRDASASAENDLLGRVNYLFGKDTRKHHTNISTFGRVRYSNIYPGIDVVYYGHDSNVESDFVVAPHANPKTIFLEMEGPVSLQLHDRDLIVSVNNESLRFERPDIYQEVDGRRVEIAGRYILKDDRTFGFEVAEYDHNKALLIDPVLRYSSFVGGSGSELGNDVKVDSSGNILLTGFTTSTNFVHTDNSIAKGGFDVFLMKFSPTGTLIFSTFFGGTGFDTGVSIATDANAIYIGGITDSSDYIVTQGAFQQTENSNQTGFFTKLNTSGTSILYSTYFGGTGGIGNSLRVAVDTTGDVYLTGSTNSTTLPVTPNAFQSALSLPATPGAGDAIVAKIHPAGGGAADLLYSSYLGGNLEEGTPHIALDAAGFVYLAGGSASTNFPTTANALQPLPGSTDIQQRKNGATDAFLVKMDLRKAGTAGLVYSTYIGGANEESVGGMALDNANNVYLTGRTSSTDFRTTNNALQTHPAGKKDAYVIKLNPARDGLAGLLYSTYLGGSEDENSFGSDIAVDANGNAYLTGDTRSTNLPVTVGAFQPSLAGVSDAFSAPGGDAFVAKLNSAGTALVYFTYLGGNAGDGASAIAIDADRNAYVSGYTFSNDFPLTANALQFTQGGSFDAFLARVENPSSFTSAATNSLRPSTQPLPSELPNPLDTPQKFVRQQYIDFLNREPDANGLTFWTNEITSCGSDTSCIEVKRINVSAAFFLSIEFQQTGYLVDRLYISAFGRTPKLQEFSPDSRRISDGVIVNSPGWEQLLEGNKQAFVASLVQRSDFQAAFPQTMTADQFVTQLDTNAGNVLTGSEKATLVAMLSGSPTDATRASVLRAIAENSTLQRRESDKAFVLMQYFGYLQRNPDDLPDHDLSGYDFWLAKLNQFNGNFIQAEMVKAFSVAGEYRKRFGQN